MKNIVTFCYSQVHHSRDISPSTSKRGHESDSSSDDHEKEATDEPDVKKRRTESHDVDSQSDTELETSEAEGPSEARPSYRLPSTVWQISDRRLMEAWKSWKSEKTLKAIGKIKILV